GGVRRAGAGAAGEAAGPAGQGAGLRVEEDRASCAGRGGTRLRGASLGRRLARWIARADRVARQGPMNRLAFAGRAFVRAALPGLFCRHIIAEGSSWGGGTALLKDQGASVPIEAVQLDLSGQGRVQVGIFQLRRPVYQTQPI